LGSSAIALARHERRVFALACCRLEGHVVAELFETANVMAFRAHGVELVEVVDRCYSTPTLAQGAGGHAG
jgi:hypothetical protein